MRGKRLLAVGQGLPASGYARALDGVLVALSSAFDVSLFAVADYGEPAERPFAVRGNRVPGDRYGREQLPGLLRELQPDVVLVHHDATFFAIHGPALDGYRRERPGARYVAYCPVDWPALASTVALALARADDLVLYTEFGRGLVARSLRELGLSGPPTDVIPHAVDTATFAPLVPGDPVASRTLARRRLFGDRTDLGGAFLVLNANRNIRRKRVDLTLRGFAEFARGRPNAWLYLHMGMLDSTGCDVRALAAELGIEDRLLTTPHEGRRPQVPDEQLHLVYNACDVGVNTCAAEGFGLVSFEHAATGAAQVVPDHSACGELWGGSAIVLPAAPVGRQELLVAPADVASALARLHDDPSLRAELGERAHALARSARFHPAAVAERWERLLGRELAQRAA
jgi:glycosyltransferase involved in cell wall biosynthesis